MKRALLALLLVACAGAPAIERTPTTVRAAVVAQPAALELSFRPSRIFAGQEPNAEHAEGTLVMVIEETEHHVRRLDELDIATMRVFRSLDFEKVDFHEANFVAFAARSNALYVVTITAHPKSGFTHTLHRVDLGSLTIAQSSTIGGEVPRLHDDHAFRPFLSVGTQGVRLTFDGSCHLGIEDERDDGCVYYETHRLGDLALAKMRVVSSERVRFADVPDDFGALPPESGGERDPHCAMHGIFGADGVWVGDNYFALRFGGCGSPPGGFFQCKAPK